MKIAAAKLCNKKRISISQ